MQIITPATGRKAFEYAEDFLLQLAGAERAGDFVKASELQGLVASNMEHGAMAVRDHARTSGGLADTITEGATKVRARRYSFPTYSHLPRREDREASIAAELLADQVARAGSGTTGALIDGVGRGRSLLTSVLAARGE